MPVGCPSDSRSWNAGPAASGSVIGGTYGNNNGTHALYTMVQGRQTDGSQVMAKL